MKLYSYASCSTCRKAIAWLKERGITPTPIDITNTPPSVEELQQGQAQLGRKRLFNTSGQSYRALGSAAVQAMDDDQAIAALAADGKLVKRPFLITDAGQVMTGFKPEEWEALLG
ncbi:MAG: arsenate reductase family protein [Cyanobacteriota bacterium]|jgi:arsenate reductase (glutaredoxin)|nr:arsenate reductase family protein [Synechococcus sp. FGCU3]MEB3105086.1 arsenate reductase family protein [Cyanobacteriota bacterium]